MNVVRSTTDDAFGDDEYEIVNGIDGKNHGVTTPTADNVTLFMNDGMMFSYNKTAAVNCTKDETIANAQVCKGFIDVNGTKGPNKVIACDKGVEDPCVVSNPTDIYPVEFFDTSVIPATAAAKAVLYGK